MLVSFIGTKKNNDEVVAVFDKSVTYNSIIKKAVEEVQNLNFTLAILVEYILRYNNINVSSIDIESYKKAVDEQLTSWKKSLEEQGVPKLFWASSIEENGVSYYQHNKTGEKYIFGALVGYKVIDKVSEEKKPRTYRNDKTKAKDILRKKYTGMWSMMSTKDAEIYTGEKALEILEVCK